MPSGSVSLTADALSTFFGEKIAKIRYATKLCSPAIYSGPCLSHFDSFRQCTVDEIRHVILQSPRKSCQLDPLPCSLLLRSLDNLLPFLHITCNSSLRDGILPECEKLALITPILKKAGLDPDSPASYMPISNLTFVSKLVERIVCQQLNAYLCEHNLLPPLQSAFRVNHSTETATLKIASDILDSADTGHVTILALLDLSAAFDTVDHDILLQRLTRTYGIGGTVLRWIRSFLTGRVQIVNYAGKRSVTSTLTCGVPQGSVSGPILFNLYTADVIRIAQSFGVSVHSYADDLQLNVHCRAEDSVAAVMRVTVCIEAIDKWFGSNRLKMNPEKTQLIWLGSRQQFCVLIITPVRLHNGTVIVPSSSALNLGVIFDSQLTMAEHVNSITRSCFYQLRQLHFIRRCVSQDAAKALVHAFISSRVDYCNSLLFGATDQVIRRLQAVMNAAARLIVGLRRSDHITPALRDTLHWLPVKQRIVYKIALLVYKCRHGMAPSYLSDYCTALTATNLHHELRSTTRSALYQPRTRTRTLGPRSFRSSGPAIWNSLPVTVTDSSLTLNLFKSRLKQHLFNLAYNTG